MGSKFNKLVSQILTLALGSPSSSLVVHPQDQYSPLEGLCLTLLTSSFPVKVHGCTCDKSDSGISRGVLRCSSTSMDSQSIAASTETIVALSRYVTYCNVTWPLHKDQLDFKTDSGR